MGSVGQGEGAVFRRRHAESRHFHLDPAVGGGRVKELSSGRTMALWFAGLIVGVGLGLYHHCHRSFEFVLPLPALASTLEMAEHRVHGF